MKKMLGIETIITAILLVMVAVIIIGYQTEKKGYMAQIRELQLRLAEAEEHPDTFYIRDSIPVVQQRVITVDKTDYKKQIADAELIKDRDERVAAFRKRVLYLWRDLRIHFPVNKAVML